jgi:hypothetical protein
MAPLHKLTRALGLCLLIVLVLGRGLRMSEAQPAPSSDMPRNLIVPAVPYEEGMANILAQGAARPKANQPILPGRPIDQPTSSAGPVGAPIAPSPPNQR